MPRDLTRQPVLARRTGDCVEVGAHPPLPLADLGEGRLELGAPADGMAEETAFEIALAAFEALSAAGPEVAIRLSHAAWAPLLPELLSKGIALPTEAGAVVLPAAFWQVSDRWLMQEAPAYPTLWTQGPHGRHPIRPPKPAGPLYRRHIPWLDQWLVLRALDLSDLDTFHRWQNDPRVAEFFEERGTREEHRAHLAKLLADPHVLPVIGSLDGRDFAYFELYWCRENRLGAQYDAAPWDRGWHVLVGEEDIRGAEYVTAWMPSLMHYMFLSEPRTRNVMGEPKASHTRQLHNLSRGGFAHLREFDFPHKRASLVRLERQHFFEARLWARPDSGRGEPLAFSPARLPKTGDWT
ncbi:GNAT family N-acetyltransferase [Celeribacter indicus]|uniref:Putative siderophore biosynthesis protein n=1 Tax=Celeribacter indicus TaxID=1208324 RepID=A0A0B5E0D5_9RHOB|nr:GNAT family N-acetyltransferase [Celeribacter indicus]AJE48694.1 putative siderophore biosynthesis protein [Celeribacter indicus]SDX12766.1 Protein N-acetyltransferase, RimJ/RimL family [Celeribacter indicus]